ncbi:MAG: type II toxin-antitoxin system PemK/MazF family toxin [Chlorobiaceae bacterium]|nr:type II toxin-antitoxin system PemK/MazF family toxin [Chlorobiaceae bacterium]
MSISYHPKQGTIVICDFAGLIRPEMVKRRPVVIVSPRFRGRDQLCTVVPLSKTPPVPEMPYHYKHYVDPALPAPYDASYHWVKGDMLYTVSLDRLDLPFDGKDSTGKRNYITRLITPADLLKIQKCISKGLGI